MPRHYMSKKDSQSEMHRAASQFSPSAPFGVVADPGTTDTGDTFSPPIETPQSKRDRRRRDYKLQQTMAAAVSSPTAPVTVPIANPRYEFKTRINRTMALTDNSASEAENTGRSAPLRYGRTTEELHINQGGLRYTEPIQYHSYACYRHGAKQIHTQSVGYSSDGDLVLIKREVLTSDGEGNRGLRSGSENRKRSVGVDSVVCLNPAARPTSSAIAQAVTAEPDEALAARLSRKYARLKKYPGVRCPKGRKTANRLLNDHFASVPARPLYHASACDSDDDEESRPAAAAFDPIPRGSDAWMLIHGTERQQEEATRRLLSFTQVGKVSPTPSSISSRSPVPFTSLTPPYFTTPNPTAPKHFAGTPQSAEFRFGQLSRRVRGELAHAATATDFMPAFMTRVEAACTTLITSAKKDKSPSKTVTIDCEDGYARLLTHGIASYYRLHSASSFLESTQDQPSLDRRFQRNRHRVTNISLPKNTVPELPSQSLLSYLQRNPPKCEDDDADGDEGGSSFPLTPAVRHMPLSDRKNIGPFYDMADSGSSIELGPPVVEEKFFDRRIADQVSTTPILRFKKRIRKATSQH